MLINRRNILRLAAAAPFVSPAFAAEDIETLTIGTRILDVKGKPAKVFGITRRNGRPGLDLVYGGNFRAKLVNSLAEETIIHWHGLTPPTSLDGVPVLSSSPMKAGEVRIYDFENRKAGTHWMHSHMGLQEQRLMAAPLIVRETEKPLFDEQEHVVLLHDFTFRDPTEILDELKGGGGAHAAHNMDHSKMDHSEMKMDAPMAMGSDVKFDAILANDRTLDDPEIVKVETGGQIRLRLINGAAATNMWVDLGELEGELIAVDGNTIKPFKAKRVPLAIAQRADIRIKLPANPGAWPIVFQSEGETLRGGVILQAGNATIAALSDQGEPGAPHDLDFERQLISVVKLNDEPVSRNEMVMLTGGDKNYNWGFNDKSMMHDTLFTVREGERVQLMMHNMTSMAHPMHLHGHYFKVVAVGNQQINGAVRDTVLVPPSEAVTIQFDADNPGTWAFHCHHIYHMNSGMMAAMAYSGAA